MKSDSVVTQIITRIADLEGVHPVDLESPLYEAIDPDTLNTLTDSNGVRQDGSYPSVEFLYYGYIVTVDGTGRVSINEPIRETAEVSGNKANRSLEDVSAEMDHRETALNRASTVLSKQDQPFVEQVTDLLEVGRYALGTEYATLSYIESDTYVFEAVRTPADVNLQTGETVPLRERPNCRKVVETERSIVLKDVETEAPELVDPAWEIASYIGAPVFVADEIYGTCCFYEMEARPEEFSVWEVTFVELLTNRVSDKLEQRHRDRALHASTFERPAGVT